jgi:hypothetical protein
VLTGLIKCVLVDGYAYVYFSLPFIFDVDSSNVDYIASDVCSKLSDE